ncbi:MAG: hypothetical protein WC374_11745, partial [Phycisphaerae bacterium]
MINFKTSHDYIEVDGVQFDISNVRLSFDGIGKRSGHPIGMAISKALEFDTEEALEGKSFEYYAVLLDSDGNAISQEDNDSSARMSETFHVQKAPVNDTTGLSRPVAYDNMVLANVAYESALDYASGEITMDDMLAEACDLTGITLAAGQGLVNGGFIVNAALEAETWREVIAAIAGANGAFAQIINNELVFTTPDSSAIEAMWEAQANEYAALNVQDVFGAVDKVIMRDTVLNESTTEGAGSNAIYIDDNLFAVDAAARSALIAEIYNALNGFTYYPFEASGLGDPAINCGDSIRLHKANGSEALSFIFAMTYKSNPAMPEDMSSLSGAAFTAAAQEVKYTSSPALRLAKLVYKQSKAFIDELAAFSELLNNPGASYVKWFKHTGEVLAECSVNDSPEEEWWTTKEVIDATTGVIRINSAGLGVSPDGGATFTNAITWRGILASSLIFDVALGGKMVIGEPEGARFEIYTSEDGGVAWPYIDGYDENNVLRSRWSPGAGLSFLDSTGANITTIATTTEDLTSALGKAITVGVGKDFASPAAAIASIPMIGNHDTDIVIDADFYDETLTIENRIGGKITLKTTSGLWAVDKLHIKDCTARVEILNGNEFGEVVVRNCLYAKVNGDIHNIDGEGLFVDASTVLYAGSIDDCGAEAVEAYDSKLYLDLHGGGNGTDAIVATNCCIYLVDDTVEDVIGNGNIVMRDSGIEYDSSGAVISKATQRPHVAMTSNTAPAPYV